MGSAAHNGGTLLLRCRSYWGFGMTSRFRSRAAVVLFTIFAVLGAVVLLPGSAVATPPHFQVPPSVQVGYTDLATPQTAYDLTTQSELPLGASQDGSRRTHVSRIYATFDLTQFAGTRVIGGTVRI